MENAIYNEKQFSGFALFHSFLAVFIIYWLNDGLFAFINTYWWIKYAKVLAVMLWFIIAWGRDSKFVARYLKLSAPIIAFLSIIWIEKLFGASDYRGYATIAINNSIYILIITAMGSFYFSKGGEKENSSLIFAWFLDIIICGILTLKELNENPMISRFLTTEDPSLYIGKGILPKGILSFGHAYALIFTILALCSCFKTTAPKKVFLAVIIVYVFYLVLKMQFAIAFLMSFFAVMIALYLAVANQNKKMYLILFLPGIVLILYVFSGYIIDFLIELLGENQELINKLNEIKSFLVAHNLAGTDIYSRFKEYANSFKSVFSTWFLGSLIMGTGEIGGHSEFFDGCAVYGIIPVYFLVRFFVGLYKKIRSKLSVKKQEYLKSGFWLFAFLSLVNTSLWSSIMVSFILIVPLILLRSDKESQAAVTKKQGVHFR